MKYILALSAFFIFISCGNTKKNVQNTTVEPSKSETCRLIVSFISKGSGPDQKAREAFSTFITEYETSNKTKISFEKYPWGREGETDYCFLLSELTKENQVKFIVSLKSKLSFSDRVLYEENTSCRHKK